MRRAFLTAGALALLALVGAAPAAARGHDRPRAYGAAPDWRALITDTDRDRLRGWRDAWTEALAAVRAAGDGPLLDAEGVLLKPDAALVPPAAPDGAYRCRVFKLGARDPGGRVFSVSPAQACRIGGGRFTMIDGVQRPAGRLWADDGTRLVFLGAMALGDERGRLGYGRDHDRDMVGVLERIGPRRWRLVLPRPHWQSLIDVIELRPAGG